MVVFLHLSKVLDGRVEIDVEMKRLKDKERELEGSLASQGSEFKSQLRSIEKENLDLMLEIKVCVCILVLLVGTSQSTTSSSPWCVAATQEHFERYGGEVRHGLAMISHLHYLRIVINAHTNSLTHFVSLVELWKPPLLV